jgi:serine O-acetyltransferase
VAAANDGARPRPRKLEPRSRLSPEGLWLLSAALLRRGLVRQARWVKKLNTALYHNSLPPEVSFCSDIRFGHRGFGTMIHSNVTIGRRVKIWHNVTLAVTSAAGSPHGIVIEDEVIIGANAVIVTDRDASLRIGRGARIGAGAVVTRDVPPGATVVGAPTRVLTDKAAARLERLGLAPEASDAGFGEVEARERAQEAVRHEHVDSRLREVVEPAP